MVFVLKKDAGEKEIQVIEQKLYGNAPLKGFNAKKHNGVLKLKEDPLTIQKHLRDEWERIKPA